MLTNASFTAVGYVTPPGMDMLRFQAVLGVYSFAGGNDDLEFIGKTFPQLNYNFIFYINVDRIHLVIFVAG